MRKAIRLPYVNHTRTIRCFPPKTRARPCRSGVTGGIESDIGYASMTERTITVAEHKQGSMDIRAQEKTFHGFVKMVTWGGAICIAVVIFMALANA